MRYNYISSYMIFRIFLNIELKTNIDISTPEDGQQLQGTSSWRHGTPKKSHIATLNNLWKLVRFEVSNEKWPFLVSSCCVFNIVKAMYLVLFSLLHFMSVSNPNVISCHFCASAQLEEGGWQFKLTRWSFTVINSLVKMKPTRCFLASWHGDNGWRWSQHLFHHQKVLGQDTAYDILRIEKWTKHDKTWLL